MIQVINNVTSMSGSMGDILDDLMRAASATRQLIEQNVEDEDKQTELKMFCIQEFTEVMIVEDDHEVERGYVRTVDTKTNEIRTKRFGKEYKKCQAEEN